LATNKKPSQQLCLVDSFDDFSDLMDLKKTALKFSLANIANIQLEIDHNLIIYQNFDEDIVPYYKPAFQLCPSKNTTYMLLQGQEPDYENELKQFHLILNLAFIPKEFVCKLVKSCSYTTSRYDNFQRHQATCLEFSVQKIIAKEKAYGINATPLDQIVESGYLPKIALLFRKTFIQTFDIETFEKLESNDLRANTVVHATHKLLSVAVGNNKGYKKCFVRSSSSHEAAVQMVKKFVDSLEEMELIHEKHIPDYFFNAIDVMEVDLKSDLNRLNKSKISQMINVLKSYVKMDIFGFNSGKCSRFTNFLP
jgi:hypothetical protein